MRCAARICAAPWRETCCCIATPTTSPPPTCAPWHESSDTRSPLPPAGGLADGLRRARDRTNGLAGHQLPPWRYVRRRGNELLAVLRGGRTRRVVPDRQGR